MRNNINWSKAGKASCGIVCLTITGLCLGAIAAQIIGRTQQSSIFNANGCAEMPGSNIMMCDGGNITKTNEIISHANAVTYHSTEVSLWVGGIVGALTGMLAAITHANKRDPVQTESVSLLRNTMKASDKETPLKKIATP